MSSHSEGLAPRDKHNKYMYNKRHTPTHILVKFKSKDEELKYFQVEEKRCLERKNWNLLIFH